MLTINNIQAAKSFNELRESLKELIPKQVENYTGDDCPIKLLRQQRNCEKIIALTKALDLRWGQLERLKAL